MAITAGLLTSLTLIFPFGRVCKYPTDLDDCARTTSSNTTEAIMTGLTVRRVRIAEKVVL